MTFHKVQHTSTPEKARYLKAQTTKTSSSILHLSSPPSPPSPRNQKWLLPLLHIHIHIRPKNSHRAQPSSVLRDRQIKLQSYPLSSANHQSWVPQPSSNTPSANSSPTAKATKPKSSPKAPPSKTSPTRPSTSPARNAALPAPP